MMAVSLIKLDYNYVYRDSPISRLTYKVPAGVYKGMYTTEKNAHDLMELESYINPAQWETQYPIYGAGGFGLVQWTPWTNFSEWAGSGWETNYNKQLQRIQYELDNGLQWIPVAQDGYMSFYDFTQSTMDPGDLAMIFERGYERGTPAEAQRRANAAKWYEYLGGAGPIVGGSVPIWLLFKLKERWS